jgi:putative pyruvate formate lyase activating enzyme
MRKDIKEIAENLRQCASSCSFCPSACGVDRIKGEIGRCGAPAGTVVYSYQAHTGEEPPISGSRGSGTVFFAYCTMACAYCQNFNFSQLHEGRPVNEDELCEIFLKLQARGCHNINLVSPTQFLYPVAVALDRARQKGLDIPVVYNTSGYESAKILREIEGMTDVYLSDIRYSREEFARRFSKVDGYVKHCRSALKEMFRQVGNLKVENGIAVKGLIIRLLILPDDISGLENTLKFIKEEISAGVHISLMSQYFPAHRADQYGELSRRITRIEYDNSIALLSKYGFKNGWIQDFCSDDSLAGTRLRPV